MIKTLKYMLHPKDALRAACAKGYFNKVNDKTYIKLLFWLRMGYHIDLKNPQTFNEKIQWLKLYDRNPLYTQLVDKYEVRKYVAQKIGEEYLIPLVGGPWDSFEEINFGSLPKQFVLKCTHDSGGLLICRDKSKLDIDKARQKINKCLRRNFFYFGREWPYKDVKPQIIVEKYMGGESITGEFEDLVDYKFFCFNNEPKLLYISRGLENHQTARMSFYDLDGNELQFCRNDYAQLGPFTMPINFDQMISLARKLAQNVNCEFVRIDLYSIKGRIYFSEITFSPCSGMIPFEPKSADEILGELFVLPIKAKA